MATPADSSSAPAPFPADTVWSIIIGASDRGSASRQADFERLVHIYWKPVCWYLVRRHGCSREDARDLTQEFFARLYDSDHLAYAGPERGRFRTFIKLQLRNVVVDELRRRSAQKRGGGRGVALAFDPDDPAEPRWPGLSPEEEFDHSWAHDLLEEAVGQLERLARAARRNTMFRAFRLCVIDSPQLSYAECAARLRIKEGDVRNYVFRLREELRSILLRLVRDTVERNEDAEEELNSLIRLAGTPP